MNEVTPIQPPGAADPRLRGTLGRLCFEAFDEQFSDMAKGQQARAWERQPSEIKEIYRSFADRIMSKLPELFAETGETFNLDQLGRAFADEGLPDSSFERVCITLEELSTAPTGVR